MMEDDTLRNVSANAATSAEDEPSGKVVSLGIRSEIDDRYGRFSIAANEFAIVAGVEDARNKSSPVG